MTYEFKIKKLYSKKTNELIREALVGAEQTSRIKVNEYRNFIDYDLIPLIRRIMEDVK